jgi:hypothetical protein
MTARCAFTEFLAVAPRPRYSTSMTCRPRYQPQLAHTVCGNREAPQLGHSECDGRARRMFADLRERVLERLIFRFGTAIGCSWFL